MHNAMAPLRSASDKDVPLRDEDAAMRTPLASSIGSKTSEGVSTTGSRKIEPAAARRHFAFQGQAARFLGRFLEAPSQLLDQRILAAADGAEPAAQFVLGGHEPHDTRRRPHRRWLDFVL